MSEPDRFRDDGDTLYDFLDEILVTCPQCDLCAVVKPIDQSHNDLFAPRRLTCVHCGYTDSWAESQVNFGDHVDGYFQRPYWLTISIQGQQLWVYNLRHLELIEAYVSAKLREHRADPVKGWQNRSLVNRLPKWMGAAKNREIVLKGIAKLKVKAMKGCL
jgi:hypothetical protein